MPRWFLLPHVFIPIDKHRKVVVIIYFISVWQQKEIAAQPDSKSYLTVNEPDSVP